MKIKKRYFPPDDDISSGFSSYWIETEDITTICFWVGGEYDTKEKIFWNPINASFSRYPTI